MICPTKLVAP